MSPPARGRELKRSEHEQEQTERESPPARGRELKQIGDQKTRLVFYVAPCAGA